MDSGFNLILELPRNNPKKLASSKWKDYPFTESGWFESNYSQIGHSKYIPVYEAYWFFWPLIPTPLRGELGHLRINFSVSKLSKSVNNCLELGEEVLKEYNDYYNSPIIGKYGLGHNAEIINKVDAHSERRAIPFSEEERKEQIEINMKNRGYPYLKEFDCLEINGVDWIRYVEIKSSDFKKKNVYASLLGDEYYLSVEFYLSTNMSHSGKNWYKDAEDSIPRLMQGVSLQPLNANTNK